MKILLDTHTVIWMALNSPLLTERARGFIFDEKNTSFVSIASAWEVSIKSSLGKLRLDGGVSEFLRIIEVNGITILPINPEYIKQVEALPFHHRDPFDRMLVATAMLEGIPLLSADDIIPKYNISVIW